MCMLSVQAPSDIPDRNEGAKKLPLQLEIRIGDGVPRPKPLHEEPRSAPSLAETDHDLAVRKHVRPVLFQPAGTKTRTTRHENERGLTVRVVRRIVPGLFHHIPGDVGGGLKGDGPDGGEAEGPQTFEGSTRKEGPCRRSPPQLLVRKPAVEKQSMIVRVLRLRAVFTRSEEPDAITKLLPDAS